jgi:hypothetical protein
MSYPALVRPSSLDDSHWEAVTRIVDRMARARSDNDWELAVGSAKELVEAVGDGLGIDGDASAAGLGLQSRRTRSRSRWRQAPE